MRSPLRQSLATAGLAGLVVALVSTMTPAVASPNQFGSARPSTARPSTVTYGPGTVFGLARTGKVALSTARVPAASSRTGQVAAGLRVLLTLPVATDRPFGIWTAVPSTVRLRSASVEGSLATVDLTTGFTLGTSARLRQRTAQVVYTATAVPGVTRVSFRINGRSVSRIGANGPYVGTSVSRSAFDGVTPAVLITSTRPGTHVTSPFTVSGTATSFEAVVHWKLTTLSGVVLARGTVLASNFSRGTFRLTVRTSYVGSVHLIVGGDAPRGNVDMVDPATTPLVIVR